MSECIATQLCITYTEYHDILRNIRRSPSYRLTKPSFQNVQKSTFRSERAILTALVVFPYKNLFKKRCFITKSVKHRFLYKNLYKNLWSKCFLTEICTHCVAWWWEYKALNSSFCCIFVWRCVASLWLCLGYLVFPGRFPG